MSNQKDPGSLIMVVVLTFVGLLVCLIIASTVFDFERAVDQGPNDNSLPPISPPPTQ